MKVKGILLGVLTLLVTCLPMAWASGGHAPVASPAEVIKGLMEGNAKFVGGHTNEYFHGYATSQHPTVTMITCSDARVHSTIFNFDPMDRIFIIRNVGNQIQNSCGSIDYGIYHLHTPVLLILGHTHCGAVKAAMGDYSGETPCIVCELNGLHLPLSGDNGKGGFEARWLLNVERNVDYQVSFCLKKYKDLVDKGELAIVGAVYDFIDAYGHGKGRVVITNLNGETDVEKIKNDPVLYNVTGLLKAMSVDRKQGGAMSEAENEPAAHGAEGHHH